MEIYERLSEVYDLGWGKFSGRYIPIIREILDDMGIRQARILDLACGTGCLAIELGRQGHFVHGIDISSHMIAIAKSKERGLSNVTFEVQDMVDFDVKDRFDLATCTYDSINYLVELDRVREMFYSVSKALHPRGKFVFDSNTDNLYADRHKGTYDVTLGSMSFIKKLVYDQGKKLAITRFEYSDGAVEEHRQRPYDMKELEPLLTDAGFTVINAFAEFDKALYDDESMRLICLVEK